MSGSRDDKTIRGGSPRGHIPSPKPSRPSSSKQPALKVGDRIADKYVVRGLLGAGGVGVVVDAQHEALGHRVAIKLLQRSAMEDPDTVSRFAREARAAAKIQSENVARVLDVGKTDSGAPYMVMERLEGQDLGAMIKERERLPMGEAIDYVLQACKAVAEAHAIGIVHRDLKPSNLFVARRPNGTTIVKVLDFGISKFIATDGVAPDEASMTQTATVIGSPLYMSPEQMESARAAEKPSDIWSLGTILYELISGKSPFNAPTMPQLCARILNGEPTPLTDFVPEAPRPLCELIDKCLQKKPEDRFVSVAELAVALGALAPRQALASIDEILRVTNASEPPPPMPAAPMGLLETTPPLAETRKETRASRRGRLLGFAFAAAVGLGLIATAVHISTRGSGDGDADAASGQAAPATEPAVDDDGERTDEDASGDSTDSAGTDSTATDSTTQESGSPEHDSAASTSTDVPPPGSATATSSGTGSPVGSPTGSATGSAANTAPPPTYPVAPPPPPEPNILDER